MRPGMLATVILVTCMAIGFGQVSRQPSHALPHKGLMREIDQNSPPVVFYTGAGKRTIEVASREGPWPELDRADYAHVIFAPIPGNAVYNEILRIGNIHRVSVHFSRREGHTHEVWVANLMGQDINDVRDRLVENFSTLFFNIDPYTYEDRLTPKTMGIQEFSPEERDEETGELLVTIRFFPDVPAERRTEIFANHSLVTHPLFGSDGVVRTNLETIRELAHWSEIRRISEYSIPLPTRLSRPLLRRQGSPVPLDRDLRGRRMGTSRNIPMLTR